MVGNRILALGLVVIVASGLMVFELIQENSRPQIDYAWASKTVHSPVHNGLVLTLTIKEIFLPQRENLTVIEKVNNTLSEVLTVTTPSITNPAYGPCQQAFATGIEVYSGNLSHDELFNNGSALAPLSLYNPSLTYNCPAVFDFQYSFQPNSAVATINSSLAGHYYRTDTRLVNESSVVAGYWVGVSAGYSFQRFTEGQYTVVAFDAWGDRVIGHFQVV